MYLSKYSGRCSGGHSSSCRHARHFLIGDLYIYMTGPAYRDEPWTRLPRSLTTPDDDDDSKRDSPQHNFASTMAVRGRGRIRMGDIPSTRDPHDVLGTLKKTIRATPRRKDGRSPGKQPPSLDAMMDKSITTATWTGSWRCMACMASRRPFRNSVLGAPPSS